jgi:hypothetical protein
VGGEKKTMEIRQIAAIVLVCGSLSTITTADTAREAFTREWVGRTVLLKQALYTLKYDERGLMGQTHRDKRDGLNVVTPFQGSFFQFDGRQKQDDVIDLDPERLVDKINVTYQADTLAVRSYQRVQPHLLHRFDPGVELIVSKMRIERDFVRLLLVDAKVPYGDEPATALTVRWPTPFSRSFEERGVIEGLIAQYLHLK